MATKYSFPSKVDKWIKEFFRGLECEPKFLKDTREHDEAARTLNRQVFSRLDELRLEEFRHCIRETGNVMKVKPNHWESILNEIDNDFPKVKRYLKFIKAFKGEAKDIDRLLGRVDNNLHIKGAGLFFITQLLAGAHLNEYIVFHDYIYESLQDLGIVDMRSKRDNGSRYMDINALCRQLYEEKFKDKMEASHKLGLQSVHNFLWHYHYHELKAIKGKDTKGMGRWWRKDC